MCTRRSHTLAPLTKLTSINRKFKWKKYEQYAFEEIKQIVFCDTLSNHPDFNETFNIHSNASALKLGEFIIQKRKPIAL